MSEDSARKFVHLELPRTERISVRDSSLVCDLVQRIIDSPVESLETNYRIAQGNIQICRLGENAAMDRQVAQAGLKRNIQQSQLTPDSRIELRLSSEHPGSMEWFEIEDYNPDSANSLEADQVEVQVQTLGLTFRDHLVATGQINETSLGTECGGIILDAGSESGFRPGDRVCLITTSAARSVVRVQASAVVLIPPEMSLDEAVSMSTAQWLAYYALVNTARVQKNDMILIHHGASCVGQMAIQLARKRGARVLVTASSANKAKFLRDELFVPEDDIFQTGDPMILTKLYQHTRGQGVDIIFGPLSDGADTSTVDLSHSLGPCGRLVDTSLRTPTVSMTRLVGNGLSSNISSSSVNMVELIQKRPSLAHQSFQDAMRIVFQEGLKPPQPLHKFSASEAQGAFFPFPRLRRDGQEDNKS